MSDDLMDQAAVDLAAAARQGSVTAVALAEASLARIAARDAEVEAWAYLDRDLVLANALRLAHFLRMPIEEIWALWDETTGTKGTRN